MDFSTRHRRQSGDPILPMINVVFLLLVFFLLTAQIAPRAPFELHPPATAIEGAIRPAPVFFVSSTRETFFRGESGEAAFAAIANGLDDGQPLTLRADASVEAAYVVQVLTRLRALGVEQVQLVGRPQ
jgi:biopolymer transport protein ExbD